MIINELMIGDFVQYNGMTCKIYCIESPFERKNEKFNNQYIATLWCNGFIDAIADEINPIPLTEEILKVNGFVDNREYWKSDLLYNYWDNERLCVEIMNDVNNVDVCVKYVHELQHALRLCGLNDLADNFKID